MREKAFENKLKKAIEQAGGWQVKYFANGFTKSGIPDVLACLRGIFIGVEVKGDGGRPSDLQIYHLKKIRKAGGVGILVYPKDTDLFMEMLQDLHGANIDKWNQKFLLEPNGSATAK